MDTDPTEFEILLHDLRTAKEDLEDYYKRQKALILGDIKDAENKLRNLCLKLS